MQCELCGKITETVPALIEGTELNVCANCASHGKILKKPVFPSRREKINSEAPEKTIVKNYAELIKRKREELGLNQEDFAKKLNEKFSTMQNIEAGHMEPTIKIAEKLKNIFALNLIEETGTGKIETKKTESRPFTLGDFIKRR